MISARLEALKAVQKQIEEYETECKKVLKKDVKAEKLGELKLLYQKQKEFPIKPE